MQQHSEPTFVVPTGNKKKRAKDEKESKKTVTHKCPSWDNRYYQAQGDPTLVYRNRGWFKDEEIHDELNEAPRLVFGVSSLTVDSSITLDYH